LERRDAEVIPVMTLTSAAQKPIPAGMIDLGIGQPSPRLLPAEALAKAASDCAGRPERMLLSYGPEQGDGPFREALAGFLTQAYRMPVDPARLFVTNGASQAIDLICSLFTRAGDTILVEEPTYFLALKIFADHHLKVVALPMDADGLDVGALEEALERVRPALLYTIPTYHNPTGVCLSAPRREKLAALARRFDLLIVADEVYHLLSYTAPPPLPLARFSAEGRVISLGSFSKILAPGMRLGWLHAGAGMIERLATCGLLDSGGGLNPFASGIARSAIERSLLDRHLTHLRRTYGSRMQAMAAALGDRLPEGAAFETPEGGFFIWVRLPGQMDAQGVLRRARAQNVAFMPGASFSEGPALKNFLRLSFAYYDTPELVEGVERLARAIAAG
jgi:DNA-binding transcriptional MocR family regulator